jgi:hypothetical protein
MSRVVIPRIQRDDPIGQLRFDHTGLMSRIRCARRFPATFGRRPPVPSFLTSICSAAAVIGATKTRHEQMA